MSLCLGLAIEPLGSAKAQLAKAYLLTHSADERVPLLAEPNDASEIKGVYFGGANLVLLAKVGKYAHVSVGGSVTTGYVDEKYITSEQDAHQVYIPLVLTRGSSVLPWVIMREKPDENSTSIGQHPTGTIAEVIGVYSDFYHISVNGNFGFISKSSVSDISNSKVVATIGLDEQTGVDTLQFVSIGSVTNDKLDCAVRVTDILGERQIIQTQCMFALDDERAIVIEDVNFDGLPDIRVAVNADENNIVYDCFINMTDRGGGDIFAKNADFVGLYNPSFDARDKRIITRKYNEGNELIEEQIR